MTDWQPIETRPRDNTVLVTVEPTEANTTFFGKRPRKTFPAYIDEHGQICDAGTCKPDSGLSGTGWRSTHWAPLPPPAPLHDSDCATHNEPAMPNGPCDCSIAPFQS